MRIFACVSGSPSAANAASTPSSPTVAGDQRPRVDLALGEHVQRVAELERRVADHEAQVDLLVDRHRRRELVGADADADDDDAREQRRAVDDALDHAGHADALEDHRVLRAPRRASRPSRHTCHQPTGRRSSFSRVPTASSSADGMSSRWPRSPAAVYGRAPRRGRRRRPRRRRCASARRPGEKSLATTVRTPFAFSIRITPEADRPAADHDRDLPLADLAAAHRVPGDGHRLGQRRDVGRQAVGHRQHQRLLDEQLLGVGAGRVRPTGRPCRRRSSPRSSGSATTGVPVGTVALAARPVLGDLAAELVAEDDRLVRAAEAVVARPLGQVGPVVEAVARVQVRAADPAAQHRRGAPARAPASARGARRPRARRSGRRRPSSG